MDFAMTFRFAANYSTVQEKDSGGSPSLSSTTSIAAFTVVQLIVLVLT